MSVQERFYVAVAGVKLHYFEDGASGPDVATHRGFHEEDIFEDLPYIACHATKHKLIGVGHMMPWFDLPAFLEGVNAFVAPVGAA
jgi:hypothetical protein